MRATACLARTRFPDTLRTLKYRAVITVALLIFAAPHGFAEDERVVRADDLFQAGLWDVAARHYEAILEDGNVPADVREVIAYRLVECFVRDGRSIEALALLEQGAIAARHPAAAFWRGQALAGSGRFADAVAEFEVHLAMEDAPYRLEAALTSSNLQLSLDNASGALQTLAAYAETAEEAAAARANLERASILLDSGYPEDARLLLPEGDGLAEEFLPFERYIRARLLLVEGDAEAAVPIFSTLLDDPAGQSVTVHHGAAIGLADAIHATAGADAASRSLLGFLSENPETPLLGAAFRRLQAWLPASPSPADATLVKLAEWIPQPVFPATGLVTAGDGVVSAWTSWTMLPDISAFAMFTRALGVQRLDTPAARHEAGVLMARLRANFPGHFLARRSLLVESRWKMEDGDMEGALDLLAIAADTSRSGATRGEALFLEAAALAKSGDAAAAAVLFDEAAVLLDDRLAEASRFNAALAKLMESPDQLPGVELTANMRVTLELEQALLMEDPASGLVVIERFLREHPDHPRATEARLAAAERAIRLDVPDVSFAQAQLDSIGAADGIFDADLRIAMVRLRIAEARRDEGDDARVIEIARGILNDAPGTPAAVEAALSLGLGLFDSGNFNDARIAFERLALDLVEREGADPALSQAAFLLAARAAALGATAQSRDEALLLFDRAIALEDAPLRGIAVLERARLLIDLNRLPVAISFLEESRQLMAPGDPLHLPAGLLLGEAVYASAAGDSAMLEKALAIYDELLAGASDGSDTLYHRLQYLRGMVLEKLPREDMPHLYRDAEAIEAYYSVIQRAGDEPPAEWEWFERSAFAALALLEKAERWQAAINLARRIASFNGPRAADAAERASQLQLRHMIWED